MGCEIYWEPKGIFRRYFGHVTGPEMTEPVIAMQADPRFDGVRYVILDLLDVETFSVTQADLELIGALDTAAVHSNPRLRLAIVATNPEIVGMVAQYEDVADGAFPTAVFSTVAEARDWANIPAVHWPATII